MLVGVAKASSLVSAGVSVNGDTPVATEVAGAVAGEELSPPLPQATASRSAGAISHNQRAPIMWQL
jgi:tetrahydrodipicolinate N-succinyltransferase